MQQDKTTLLSIEDYKYLMYLPWNDMPWWKDLSSLKPVIFVVSEMIEFKDVHVFQEMSNIYRKTSMVWFTEENLR